MTCAEALQYIEELKPGGMKLGLDRMRRGLELLGHPERRLRVVHVAGTNGKGSTARMVQAIATAAGYATGLFSSPAVIGLRETITVDGEAIPEAAFAGWVDRLRALQSDMGEAGGLSEFELTTLLALAWFAERNTDLCVIECGMGGREDATNVFDAPLAAVITPVALDHTAWLGGTAEEIAAHKCGIIKAPCGVVTAPDQDPDALAVIWETAARQGLTVRQPGTGAAPLLEASLGRTVFAYGEKRYTLPLTGAFQRDNALTALETVDCLRDKGYTFTEEAVAAGLAGAYLPCRQEVLRPDPLVLADGAHNPHGVAALADTLRRHRPQGGLTMVIGMLGTRTRPPAPPCWPLCAPISSAAPRPMPGRCPPRNWRSSCAPAAGMSARPAARARLSGWRRSWPTAAICWSRVPSSWRRSCGLCCCWTCGRDACPSTERIMVNTRGIFIQNIYE